MFGGGWSRLTAVVPVLGGVLMTGSLRTWETSTFDEAARLLEARCACMDPSGRVQHGELQRWLLMLLVWLFAANYDG